MGKNKIIIWGHKLHSHTHSYIHNAYYNAFKELNFDTYWFDDMDNVSNFNFENCIFLTEGQVDKKIPLVKSSKYIIHHCDEDKYSQFQSLKLCNYVAACKLGISYNYKNSTVSKLNYFTYFDEKNNALYQPWATTLHPENIQTVIPFDNSIKEIYYTGTVWSDNINEMILFQKGCNNINKNLVIINKASDDQLYEFTKKSCVSPDVRLAHHVNVGYIPCRIFKNISLGKIPATNSEYIRDFFGENLLPYDPNPENLAKANIDFYQTKNYNDLGKFLMEEVKSKHTYHTRIKNILSVL